MVDNDPLMGRFWRSLGNSIERWGQLSPQQRLKRSVGEYSNLAEFANRETREGDWVTLHNLRHVDISGNFLRVNITDVVQLPGFFPLPRQVLLGRDIEHLREFPTVFVRDGFPGTNYFCRFFVRDHCVGLINGRLAGLSRYDTTRFKEAGVVVENPPWCY